MSRSAKIQSVQPGFWFAVWKGHSIEAPKERQDIVLRNGDRSDAAVDDDSCRAISLFPPTHALTPGARLLTVREDVL
jgi:hypothetical protein